MMQGPLDQRGMRPSEAMGGQPRSKEQVGARNWVAAVVGSEFLCEFLQNPVLLWR